MQRDNLQFAKVSGLHTRNMRFVYTVEEHGGVDFLFA